MNIGAYEQDYLDELKCFVAQCDYLPFLEYGVSRDLIANFITGELSDIFSNGGFVFLAKEQKEIIGLIASEKLEWDSKHFGFNRAKISYLLASGDYFKAYDTKQKLVSHLIGESYRRLALHLSARVCKEDISSIHALEGEGFRLMDVLVTYSFQFQKQGTLDIVTSYPVRKFVQADLPKLIEISIKCFRDFPNATDRFHADPVLSKEKSDQVYIGWLTTSFQKSSSEILVAERDGNPVGFSLCTINKPFFDKIGIRLGSIALTAVQPSDRNKLVATSLLKASLHWFRDKVDIVETGGQVSNYPVQRAWNKVGLRIARSQCTFHWSVLPNTYYRPNSSGIA